MASLNEILTHMEAFETEKLEFDPTTHAELFELAKQKIDSYKELIDTLESDISRYKQYSKEFSERAKIAEGKMEGLRYILATNMKVHGMPSIKGNTWEVSLRTRKGIDVLAKPNVLDLVNYADAVQTNYAWVGKSPTADIANALMLAGLDSGIVETQLSWDEKKLKEALASDTEGKLKDIAAFKETDYVAFSAKKGFKQ